MKLIRILLCFLIIILFFACEDLTVKPSDSNQNIEDFEAVWNRINDVYPFFEFKKIDRDSIYTVYSPRAEAAKGDEFYYVLNNLLAELKDGHVYYKVPGGGEVYPFYPARHFKDRRAYNPFVVRKYFDKEPILTSSTSAEYQILPNNIGSVFLADFHDNHLINEFPGIMEYLKDTKGLIIDIRQKRGGTPQNVEAVVSRFIMEPMVWPKFYSLGKQLDIYPMQPQGPCYENPVVVLINGSTYRAGEITVECLKQLPNVIAVGDTTGGGSGISANNSLETVGEFKLPIGKTYIDPARLYRKI